MTRRLPAITTADGNSPDDQLRAEVFVLRRPANMSAHPTADFAGIETLDQAYAVQRVLAEDGGCDASVTAALSARIAELSRG